MKNTTNDRYINGLHKIYWQIWDKLDFMYVVRLIIPNSLWSLTLGVLILVARTMLLLLDIKFFIYSSE